ncbi:D-glycero-beta-D-manno-heptose 1-phosphate adenylyltransferase [Actinomadura gamaensis]|uniref:D-glycero-beta-D-manno-heptose 1-phosphate adenylyltransferase n=1 Tax=Actinomadura gamaensis TaxID=1763541 RepID=A0ABV9TUP9_9ACTN
MNGPLVVVGDTLLDVDLVGQSARLSPDAPVPVIEHAAERSRPGGAGLAALLAAAEGAEVVLVTALSDDEAGRRLRALLRPHVNVAALRLDGPTPVKTRIRSGDHAVARLDAGEGRATAGPVSPAVAAALSGAGAVLVSDYGRGVASQPAVRALLERLPDRVPIVWDPHPRGGPPVRNTLLATPNEDEARRLTGAGDGVAASARHARELAARWDVSAVAVTLGPRGALLCQGEGPPFLAPAEPASGDPCGAGDGFAAATAWALGTGGALTEAVTRGVRTASRYVAAGGAVGLSERLAETGAPIVPAGREDDAFEVAERTRRAGGTVVATGGCFDLLHAGHVSLLQQARRLGDCLVVCVNSDASVRRAKGPGRPVTTAADRTRVLRALSDVDATVVFDDDTPTALLERLRPDVWVKGADYADRELPEAATVRAWDGAVVLLPLLEGRSTTRILAAAR